MLAVIFGILISSQAAIAAPTGMAVPATPLPHVDAAALRTASLAALNGKSKIVFTPIASKATRPGMPFPKSTAPRLSVSGSLVTLANQTDLQQLKSLHVSPAPPEIDIIQSADGTAAISASKEGVIWGKHLGGYVDGRYQTPTVTFSQHGCAQVKAAVVTWFSADGTELHFTAHDLRMKAPADANAGFFAGPAPDAYVNVKVTTDSGSASGSAQYEYDLQSISVTASINAYPPYLVADSSAEVFKAPGNNFGFGQPTQYFSGMTYENQTPEQKFHPDVMNPSTRVFALTGSVDGKDGFSLQAINGYGWSPYSPAFAGAQIITHTGVEDGSVSLSNLKYSGNYLQGDVVWSLRHFADMGNYTLSVTTVGGPVGFRPFLSMSKMGGMCED